MADQLPIAVTGQYAAIDARTSLFGVIGCPIAHSLSPSMHNAALRAMKFAGVFLAFEVQDTAGALNGMRALGIRGLSVTIPHKIAVMDHLDAIDEEARRIGAVNTVVNQGGRLKGFNTDCYGATAALKEKTELSGKQAAVLGAGGASRAVAFSLQAEGAQVTIYNRSRERGMRLAQDLGVVFAPLSEFGRQKVDIVVNTTSVGMLPHIGAMPVPERTLGPSMVVMDIVYNPLQTALLNAARAKGCVTIDGLAMFVYQGARQLELWTGRKAPLEIMRQAVLDAMASKVS